jgi:hypothetical protein
MKKYIPLLIITIALYSCSKNTDNITPIITEPSYIGEYNAINGDTLFVSKVNDTFTKITWCYIGNFRLIFDSVKVADHDLSFTDNEYTLYDNQQKQSIGTGNFGNNTALLHFVVDGNVHVRFDGIKRQ